MVRWVVERSGNDIDYIYAGEGSEEALPQYEITALPEGFVETERNTAPSLVDVIYENESGDILYLDYVYMRQGALTRVPLSPLWVPMPAQTTLTAAAAEQPRQELSS